MTQDTNLQHLIINKLTKEQYEGATINPDEFYLVTDEDYLDASDIVDNVLSTATDKALSANQGKVLQDEITHLQGIGRFLALWDATTGLAETNPPVSPYTYKTGDYFIVGVVGATNYKPSGSSYTTGVASSTVETETIEVGNVYYYDGTTWKLQAGGGGGTITDVQVDGTSVVTSGVANIPVAYSTTKGVVLVSDAGYGIKSMNTGQLQIHSGDWAKFTSALTNPNQWLPIVTKDLLLGMKAFLGTTITNTTSNTTWNDTEKANARNTIGAQVVGDYELSSTIQTLSATDSITLADNTIYNGGTQTALTITLPLTVDVSFLCEIDFTSGTTATTLSYSNTIKWAGDDVNNNVFLPVASKRYTIICAYDGVNYRFTVKGVE